MDTAVYIAEYIKDKPVAPVTEGMVMMIYRVYVYHDVKSEEELLLINRVVE